MQITDAQRTAAGLSFVFAAGERPDGAAWRVAMASCQAQAQIVREQIGSLELVASGLAFDVDGLAPAQALRARPPVDADREEHALVEAVRLYPGHSLSGGLTMPPVVRAMLALAAELALALPVRAIHWHPADTLIAPDAFSRSVLAWLAGGAFPATGLVALVAQPDGSVASRGLAHFAAQEMSLRGYRGEDALKIANLAVDRIVRTGAVPQHQEWTIAGELVQAGPNDRPAQILVSRIAN